MSTALNIFIYIFPHICDFLGAVSTVKATPLPILQVSPFFPAQQHCCWFDVFGTYSRHACKPEMSLVSCHTWTVVRVIGCETLWRGVMSQLVLARRSSCPAVATRSVDCRLNSLESGSFTCADIWEMYVMPSRHLGRYRSSVEYTPRAAGRKGLFSVDT